MPDFRFSRRRAVIDFSVQYKTSADPAAQSHIKDWIETRPGAAMGLPKPSEIGVVVNKYRRSSQG